MENNSAGLRAIASYLNRFEHFSTNEKVAELLGLEKTRFTRLLKDGKATEKFAGKTRAEWQKKLLDDFNLVLKKAEDGQFVVEQGKNSRLAVEEPLQGFRHYFVGCVHLKEAQLSTDRSQLGWSIVLKVSDNWKNAAIDWYFDMSGQIKTEFVGKIHEPENGFIKVISIEEKVSTGQKRCLLGTFVLNKTTKYDREINTLQGTFSIFLESIFAGKVIFNAVKSKQEAERWIGNSAEMAFQAAVFGQTTVLPIFTRQQQLGERLQKGYAEISKIQGRYVGYYFSAIEKSICEIELVIRPNRTVSYRSTQNPKRVHGFAYFLSQNRFQIVLDLHFGIFPMLSATLDFEFQNQTSMMATGNYLVANFNQYASAGRIFLRKTDDSTHLSTRDLIKIKTREEEALRQLFSREEPALLPFLLGDGNDFYLDDTYKYLYSSMSDPVGELYHWAGVYECYCFSHFETDNKTFIQKMYLKIAANGAAELKSVSIANKPYLGRFRKHHSADDIIIGVFPEYNPDREINFLMTLWRKDSASSTDIYATYGGKSPRNPRPTAGRMRLYKMDCDFEAVKPKNINLKIRNEVVQLIKDRKGIIDFFSGEEDNMVESYRQLHENILLPRSDVKKDERKRLKLPGVYLSLRVRQAENKINVNPIVIFDDHRFEMKSTRQGSKPYYGAVNFYYGNLTFYTTWEGDRPHYSFSIFEIGNLNILEIDIARGIGLTLTRLNPKPISGLEVLIPLSKDIQYEHVESFVLPLDADFNENSFPNLNDKISVKNLLAAISFLQNSDPVFLRLPVNGV